MVGVLRLRRTILERIVLLRSGGQIVMEWYVELLPGHYSPHNIPPTYSRTLFLQHIPPTYSPNIILRTWGLGGCRRGLFFGGGRLRLRTGRLGNPERFWERRCVEC